MSLPDTILANKKTELISVATAMIEGRLHFIEGSRKICALRFDVGQPEHEVFVPIRAVESETDHFPLGDVRARCAPDYLRKMDAEMNKYIDAARQQILSACQEIVRVFS